MVADAKPPALAARAVREVDLSVAKINPDIVQSPLSFQCSSRRPVRLREEDDGYPHIVAKLADRWRVIKCRDDLQWILQRRSGERGGAARWKSERFCRTRDGLMASIRAFVVDPTALPELPERYVEGR